MYLYLLNQPSFEDKIAQLECKSLTGTATNCGYALSPVYVELSRPAYFEACIDIMYLENSLDSLYKDIENMNYTEDGFRVRFINTTTHMDFGARKGLERTISNIFSGCPNLKNPNEDFIMTFWENRWLFGKMMWKTGNRWLLYNKKPHTFCNSLPARMSRALVNIAAMNNTEVRILDPCCGMGTVVLQARDMGMETYGCDINPIVVEDANKNLVHFGFAPDIDCRDAMTITGFFDVSIVDLPYGVLSKKGSDMHKEIIANIRNVCSRSVILSGGDISPIISSSGFKIVESCIVHKGGLDRHIYVCI